MVVIQTLRTRAYVHKLTCNEIKLISDPISAASGSQRERGGGEDFAAFACFLGKLGSWRSPAGLRFISFPGVCLAEAAFFLHIRAFIALHTTTCSGSTRYTTQCC